MISIKFLAGFQLESFLEMGAVLSVPNPGVFRKGWQTMIVLLLSLAGFVLLQSELVFPVSLFLQGLRILPLCYSRQLDGAN